MWLLRTLPYLDMASGLSMNIVNIDNGDRSGYENGTFSTTKLGEMSLSVTMELE